MVMFDKEPNAIDSDVAPEGLMAFVLHVTKKSKRKHPHAWHSQHSVWKERPNFDIQLLTILHSGASKA